LGPYDKKVDTGQVTPFTFDSINPADHVIHVNLAGYHEASESVTVTESSTTVADFQLIPIPSGSIIVTSTPAGLEIYLDNNATGQVTPFVLSNIPEGDHVVKVTKPCLVTPDSKSVNVIVGGTVSADFVLVSDEHCFKQIPDFTANTTIGSAPLPVSFTDLSMTNPTGWAWFFGDENYAVPWTQITDNTGWSAAGQSSVVMPDGNIVLIGIGNEVWRSTDGGLMWTTITEHAEWLRRVVQSSVVMPDGAIILMSGFGDKEGVDSATELNEVWRSTDEGETWMQMTANAGWPPRFYFCSVAMPDGNIVLMGGGNQEYGWNDAWRSTDDGITWTRMTANAGWSPRVRQSCVVLPDGNIVLMGGFDQYSARNDVWRSTDEGATWIQVSSSAEWSGRGGHSSVVMPDGSIILMGGVGDWYLPMSDIWRSTDEGATWIQMNSSAEWSGRVDHSSVVMPDGSIVLMGGDDSGGHYFNDVWRLNPAGSSAQNPLHVYTTPGTYQVSLQVYNVSGFNSIRKSEYINVFSTNAGNISVSSNPGGAKIFLDGADTGHETPFTLQDVAAGDHQVSVTKDCYITPDPQNVIVIAGERVTTDFTLQPSGSCIPEFPSMVVPAVVLAGGIGVVLFLAKRE